MGSNLREHIIRGKRAIALAKVKGLDTSEWENKLQELLARLSLKATDGDLCEIERRMKSSGYVLLWSDAVKDLVVFYDDKKHLRNIPSDFVPYSSDELWHLFGDEEYSPSRGDLLRIHQAKKTSATIIDVREDQP